MAGYGVDVGGGKPFKAPPGPPMTLANMRENGVRRLRVYCLAPYCHHSTVIEADTYADALTVKSFNSRMVCTRCGLIGADVRPNWSDQPARSPLIGPLSSPR
jgi:hypothetical protein